jgi:hypothetical protein
LTGSGGIPKRRNHRKGRKMDNLCIKWEISFSIKIGEEEYPFYKLPDEIKTSIIDAIRFGAISGSIHGPLAFGRKQ